MNVIKIISLNGCPYSMAAENLIKNINENNENPKININILNVSNEDKIKYVKKEIKTFPQIYFNNTGDKDKILTIEQWGDIEWTSMQSAFNGSSNLKITNVNIDAPNLSGVTQLNDMFNGATSFNYDISDWDVSNITDMSNMFSDAYEFNGNIGGWDTSKVENMERMFEGAEKFNQDISGWDVKKSHRHDGNVLRGRKIQQIITS